MPRALERILDALAPASPASLRRPLCPRCGSERALVAADPDMPERVCTPCGRAARQVTTRCGLCDGRKVRHAGVAGVDYCRRCWTRIRPQAAQLILAQLRCSLPGIDAVGVLEQIPGGPDRMLRLALELEASGAAWFAAPAAGSVQFAGLYDLARAAGADLPDRRCGRCAEVTSSLSRLDGLLCCRRCYAHARHDTCGGCGQSRALERRLADGRRLCQSCSRERPEASAACLRCGRHRLIGFRTATGPICSACRDLETVDTCSSCGRDSSCRFAGTPSAICESCATGREACHSCGHRRPVHSRTTAGGPICHGCAPTIVEVCTDCGRERIVAGRVPAGPLCTLCLPKNPGSWHDCSRCGRHCHLDARRLCSRCRADDLIATLFPSELVASDTRIEQLHAACLAAEPAVTLGVFRRKTTVMLLHELLRTPGEITHELLDASGSVPATRAIRAMLVEHGVLPPRNESLARLERWIHDTAQGMADPVEARAFIRFARWRHLRHLRELPASAPASTARSRRRELVLVAELLAWARDRGRTLSTLTQGDVDRWRTCGPPERHRVKVFLDWARSNKLASRITVVHTFSRTLTVAGLDDDGRWRLLAGVFADGSTQPSSRFAAAMVLLYGVRVSRLIELRLDDVEVLDGLVLVRLGSVPLALPDELGEIAAATAGMRTAARMFGPVQDADWLFPGTTPGQPLSADALTARIQRLGVMPGHARAGALASLAQQLPAPIMARLMGLHPTTAGRWTDAVSASQAGYAALKLPTTADSNPKTPQDPVLPSLDRHKFD